MIRYVVEKQSATKLILELRVKLLTEILESRIRRLSNNTSRRSTEPNLERPGRGTGLGGILPSGLAPPLEATRPGGAEERAVARQDMQGFAGLKACLRKPCMWQQNCLTSMFL